MRRRRLRPLSLIILFGSILLIGILALTVGVAPVNGLESGLDLQAWIVFIERLTTLLGDQTMSEPPTLQPSAQLEAVPFISPTARTFPPSPSIAPNETQSQADPARNPELSLNTLHSTTTLDGTGTFKIDTSPTIIGSPTTFPPGTITPTRTPTPTHIVAACLPPPTWVSYFVQLGDTLAQLAIRHSTNVASLQAANCLPGTILITGQLLYVPDNAPPTSTSTAPQNPTITVISSQTNTSTLAPSATISSVPSSTATHTHTPTPTLDYSSTHTQTPTITITPSHTTVPPSTPTTTHTPQGPQPTATVDLAGCSYANSSSLENQILSLINDARNDNGVSPLGIHPSLRDAAREHSNDMSCNDFVSHNGSNGTDVYLRVTGHGYFPSWWGENIYMGVANDPQATFNWWMNSAPHRANILNPNYIHIGVGYSDGNGYNAYTLNFGRP